MRHPYGDENGAATKTFKTAWASLVKAASRTAAGFGTDLRWHDLRHECGSRLGDAGVDVRRIQELLGHSSLMTTQRYLNTDAHSVARR